MALARTSTITQPATGNGKACPETKDLPSCEPGIGLCRSVAPAVETTSDNFPDNNDDETPTEPAEGLNLGVVIGGVLGAFSTRRMQPAWLPWHWFPHPRRLSRLRMRSTDGSSTCSHWQEAGDPTRSYVQ